MEHAVGAPLPPRRDPGPLGPMPPGAEESDAGGFSDPSGSAGSGPGSSARSTGPHGGQRDPDTASDFMVAEPRRIGDLRDVAAAVGTDRGGDACGGLSPAPPLPDSGPSGPAVSGASARGPFAETPGLPGPYPGQQSVPPAPPQIPPAPLVPPAPVVPPAMAGWSGDPRQPSAPAPAPLSASTSASAGWDATGHLPLPPGALVPLPHPPQAPASPGTGSATLAVLLIGPAGAGKTSVARYWAEHRPVPTASISLDDVREWVRAGFADPQSGWNEHSEAQYRLARRTCGFAARNFLANGISCILDDAVFPDRPVVGLGGWKRHVGPGLLPVVLLPGLDIVLERNAGRTGNRRLADEEVAGIHGRMAGWYGSGLPIIDNSSCDVPTTARMLDEVLARSISSPPAW